MKVFLYNATVIECKKVEFSTDRTKLIIDESETVPLETVVGIVG